MGGKLHGAIAGSHDMSVLQANGRRACRCEAKAREPYGNRLSAGRTS